MLTHPLKRFPGGGDGAQKMAPDWNRHGETGEGESSSHAGDERGASQQRLNFLETAAISMGMKVEIQDRNDYSKDGIDSGD